MTYIIQRSLTFSAQPEQFIAAIASEALPHSAEVTAPAGSLILDLDGDRFSIWQRERAAWMVHGRIAESADGANQINVSWRFATPIHSRLLSMLFSASLTLLFLEGVREHNAAQAMACASMLLLGVTLLAIQTRYGHPVQRELEAAIIDAAARACNASLAARPPVCHATSEASGMPSAPRSIASPVSLHS